MPTTDDYDKATEQENRRRLEINQTVNFIVGILLMVFVIGCLIFLIVYVR